MIRRFVFDSTELAPEDAFEAYRRLYAQGSDVTRGERDFLARVRAVRLDGMILFERELDGVVHARGARARRDGFDHFALHLVLEGELRGSAESRFDRAGPDDLVLADTLRPSRTEARGLKVLTASIPRSVVMAASTDLGALHGLAASAPDTLMLRDLMRALIAHAERLRGSAMPALRRSLVEMLAIALDDGRVSIAAAGLDMARKEMATRFIADHLADRRLDARRVGEGVGLSRSALYRLFEAHGGVAQFIMTRRLAAVRDALEQGAADPISALAQQFGFADESHLNRRFSRAYGRPVGAFRREMLGDGDDAVSTHARRWAGWMIEVD